MTALQPHGGIASQGGGFHGAAEIVPPPGRHRFVHEKKFNLPVQKFMDTGRLSHHI